MPIISADNADQVKTFLQDNLQDSVSIELFTRKRSMLFVPGQPECETCEDTEALLSELAVLSDKLSLEVHDLKANPVAGASEDVASDMVPTIVLRGKDRGKVRFMGLPAGYEFSTLIQDLANVSKGTTSLSQATRDDLAALAEDVHIRVFVTPT
ncbi:MAG: hypothetical protein ACRDIY_21605 [Chloroflexota bacterium]